MVCSSKPSKVPIQSSMVLHLSSNAFPKETFSDPTSHISRFSQIYPLAVLCPWWNLLTIIVYMHSPSPSPQLLHIVWYILHHLLALKGTFIFVKEVNNGTWDLPFRSHFLRVPTVFASLSPAPIEIQLIFDQQPKRFSIPSEIHSFAVCRARRVTHSTCTGLSTPASWLTLGAMYSLPVFQILLCQVSEKQWRTNKSQLLQSESDLPPEWEEKKKSWHIPWKKKHCLNFTKIYFFPYIEEKTT